MPKERPIFRESKTFLENIKINLIIYNFEFSRITDSHHKNVHISLIFKLSILKYFIGSQLIINKKKHLYCIYCFRLLIV